MQYSLGVSMNVEHFVLDGGYQWEAAPPATAQAIAALIASTVLPLPATYLQLLRLTNGGEASLACYPSYVRVWSSATVIAYNRDYDIPNQLPGLIGFGDNGGPDLVGFDTRAGQPYPVCAVPFVPMAWADAMLIVPNFDAFLHLLLPRAANE